MSNGGAEDYYDNPKQDRNLISKSVERNTPRFLQVDRRIAETTSEVEALKALLKSKEAYLKELNTLRKTITLQDEAKIQALISVGLL